MNSLDKYLVIQVFITLVFSELVFSKKMYKINIANHKILYIIKFEIKIEIEITETRGQTRETTLFV